MQTNTLSSTALSQTADEGPANITVNFLRIASILALVQYSAHALLFLTGSLSHSSPIASVAASRTHSYWDFSFGYGLLAIVSGVVEVILLWQLASIAKRHSAEVRPAVALFIFANLTHAVLVWRYFSLIAPVVFDIIIAMLLVCAFLVGQRKRAEANP